MGEIIPETTDATTDEQPDELERIPATEMRSISLAATFDVSDLPTPVRNYLHSQAVAIEREFRRDVREIEQQRSLEAANPLLIEKIQVEATVDVTDTDADRRIELFEKAREFEAQLRDAVYAPRETYGDV